MPKKQKKERNDAKKNKAKVIKALLKDPLKSQTKIAKETGLAQSTVNSHIKNMKPIKDDSISRICATDINIVKLAQEEIQRRIMSKKREEISVRDLSAVARDSEKRYQIFIGDITDSK